MSNCSNKAAWDKCANPQLAERSEASVVVNAPTGASAASQKACYAVVTDDFVRKAFEDNGVQFTVRLYGLESKKTICLDTITKVFNQLLTMDALASISTTTTQKEQKA